MARTRGVGVPGDAFIYGTTCKVEPGSGATVSSAICLTVTAWSPPPVVQIVHIAHMNYTGFKFVVLANAFIVHR